MPVPVAIRAQRQQCGTRLFACDGKRPVANEVLNCPPTACEYVSTPTTCTQQQTPYSTIVLRLLEESWNVDAVELSLQMLEQKREVENYRVAVQLIGGIGTPVATNAMMFRECAWKTQPASGKAW